ncbi:MULTISPECIES: hypothetical protein [Clostridium]|jgi:hypothetical protein|uniref:hypothetical protein n=1 Tax=Clostridium TaxID=1485 RepID=UPI000C07193D|nr:MULTISPECIES: hypothetical protein [Clostridium]MDU2683512.1 hypothetical protein [Clostridium sp.]
MRINFCMEDGGEILYSKESKEVKHVIDSITREGTEVNLYFGKDNYFHGYVGSYMYNVNVEEDKESLDLYLTENYNCTDSRIMVDELKKINKNIE